VFFCPRDKILTSRKNVNNFVNKARPEVETSTAGMLRLAEKNQPEKFQRLKKIVLLLD
jgi:hypothetical protein